MTEENKSTPRYVKYVKSVHGDQNPKATFRGGMKGENLSMNLGDVKPVSVTILDGLQRKHGGCFEEVDEKTFSAFQKRRAKDVAAAREKAAKDLASNRGPLTSRG